VSIFTDKMLAMFTRLLPVPNHTFFSDVLPLKDMMRALTNDDCSHKKHFPGFHPGYKMAFPQLPMLWPH
jgi:hypothetical protein